MIYILIATIIFAAIFILIFKPFNELSSDFWLNGLINLSTAIGSIGVLTLLFILNFKEIEEYNNIFDYSVIFIISSLLILLILYIYYANENQKEKQYIYFLSEYLMGIGINGFILGIILMYSEDSLLKDIFTKYFNNEDIVKLLNGNSNIVILILSIGSMLSAILINSYMVRNNKYNKT
ncbi:MAG: hypothetical protein QM487_04245 [Candidatus Marithrix sp.]